MKIVEQDIINLTKHHLKIVELLQTKLTQKIDLVLECKKELAELSGDDPQKYWLGFMFDKAADDVKELKVIYDQCMVLVQDLMSLAPQEIGKFLKKSSKPSSGEGDGLLLNNFTQAAESSARQLEKALSLFTGGASPSGGALPKVGATPSGAMNKTTGQLQHERGSLPKPNRVLDS